MEKKELIGLSKEELTAELVNIGEKAFRAKQLWQWIYFRGETDFDKMTNISKDLREKLKQHFSISRPKSLPSKSQQTRPTNGCWNFQTASGLKRSIFRKKTAAPCVFPRKSAVRSAANSAIPEARKSPEI